LTVSRAPPAHFQSFWFGDALSPYEQLAMKSFIDRGHRYTLYAYQALDVPRGVELCDAGEILPRDRVFHYGERAGAGRGSVSAFSNLFRYALLRRHGGWWVDTDVVCLSDDVPQGDIFVGWETAETIGSAILRFPAGHPALLALCERCERAGTDVAWGEIGPRLMTEVATEHGLRPLARAQPVAYPVSYHDALYLLMPARRDEVAQKLRAAPFLHFWNEVKRRAVILPSIAPPDGSHMATLFERHGVGVDNAPRYTADQIQRLADNYGASFSTAQAEAARLQAQLRDLERQADTLRGEIARQRADLVALLASKSWRVTAPLRWVVSRIKRLRG